MKSLIIGSSGLLGRALSRQLPQALKTVYKGQVREPQVFMDITKYESMMPLFDWYRPKVVYLCSANTDVDACENLETNLVNIRGAVTVLRLCEQFECKLVFFSSSYVFDGKSDVPYGLTDEPHPINNYGMQKDTVEKLILKSDAKFVIIRTVGIFGTDPKHRNFVGKIYKLMFENKKIFVPDDQWVNPIWSGDLARIAVQLAEHEQGLFHVAGDSCVTKAEFARMIERYFDMHDKITPMHSNQMGQAAKRPKMGCLDSYELETLGITVPSLKRSLHQYLDSGVSEA